MLAPPAEHWFFFRRIPIKVTTAVCGDLTGEKEQKQPKILGQVKLRVPMALGEFEKERENINSLQPSAYDTLAIHPHTEPVLIPRGHGMWFYLRP